MIRSEDPGTGEIVWEGRATTSEELQEAFLLARSAFLSWSILPIEERVACMERFATLLEEQSNEMAETISLETGKPLWESREEVAAMIGKVVLSVEAQGVRAGATERSLNGVRLVTRHRPHGVVAVLGPFNLPGLLPLGHSIPALLAGNCVLFKPSEQTPRTGELIAGIWSEVLPSAVFTLLQGDSTLGEEIARHPKLDGLFFTGSPEVGHRLSEHFGKHPDKILTLEMGGNAPIVVWGCSDKGAAAYLTILSAYLTSGQRCSCARRLIIPRGSEGDLILDGLMAMLTRVRVGHFRDDPEPFMGPLISNAAVDRLLAAQAEMIERGGESLIEMTRFAEGRPYLQPGLIDMTDVSRHDQEVFGPLLQVIRVSNFESAIEEANHTAFGLAASFIGDNPEHYATFRRRVRAGVINWNRQTTGASSAAPFGGVGASGNHRPSAYYAADYCAYPVASIEVDQARMPDHMARGIDL